MRTIDFSQVTDADEFSPVPEGRYPIEIEQVEESVSQKGDDLLKLRLRILDGEHAGAVVFDKLYFTEKALPRIKHVLKALGITATGELMVGPELLTGKRCLVDVIVDTYVRADGNEGKSNSVPFAGYHREEGEEIGNGTGESITPF